MARIRTIKPDFWTNEKVVDVSMPARLLFIGLWNFVDDDGRIEFAPRTIKMKIFPGDTIDVSPLFEELAKGNLVTIYTVDNKQYLHVNGFNDHQKIDKRSPSKLPEPPKHSTNSPELPRSPPTEGKGMERNGEEGNKDFSNEKSSPPPKRSVRGMRLMDHPLMDPVENPTECCPDDWGEWAILEHKLSVGELIEIWEEFRNYWKGKAGKDAVKVDWFATWQNGVIRAIRWRRK